MSPFLIALFILWALALAWVLWQLRRAAKPRLRVTKAEWLHAGCFVFTGEQRGRDTYRAVGRAAQVRRKAMAIRESVADKLSLSEEAPQPLPEQPPSPDAPQSLAASAEQPEKKPAPSPKRHGRSRRLAIVLFAALDVALVAAIFLIAQRFYGFTPPWRASPAPAASDTAVSSPAPTPNSTPEPTPATAPAPTDALVPQQPQCSLFDTADYAVGTEAKFWMQEDDAATGVLLEVAVADEGTGEIVYYMDKTPIEQGQQLSLTLAESNNYIITARLWNAGGEASEDLVLGVKIYN